MSDSERIVRAYQAAWTAGRRAGARELFADDARFDWNLDRPADADTVVEVLARVSSASVVSVAAATYAHDGAAVVYDCAGFFGALRVAEFHTVRRGRIAELRQVYDLVALKRFFPDLLS